LATLSIPGAYMILFCAPPIRQLFAETILKGGQSPSQTELIALAWTLRNRAEQAKHGGGTAEKGMAEVEAQNVCQALLSEIGAGGDRPRVYTNGNGNGHAADAATQDSRFQQALACVSLVCDGLVPDPTGGATRVHRHDAAPGWASDCEATALIGDLLFLRSEMGLAETDDTAETKRDS